MTPDARPMSLLCLLEGKGPSQPQVPCLGSGPSWADSRDLGFFLLGSWSEGGGGAGAGCWKVLKKLGCEGWARPPGSWGVKTGGAQLVPLEDMGQGLHSFIFIVTLFLSIKISGPCKKKLHSVKELVQA